MPRVDSHSAMGSPSHQARSQYPPPGTTMQAFLRFFAPPGRITCRLGTSGLGITGEGVCA